MPIHPVTHNQAQTTSDSEPDPIHRMARLSTGTVDIHPEHAYGSSAPTYWWILTSSDWLTQLPINVYVVEHQHGLVVFDTGQDRASVTDPDYFPSGPLGVVYRRLARFDIEPDQTLPTQLKRIGYDPADVDYAVVSHLHQDHIGGLADLPNARIVLAADEHQTLSSRFAEANGVLRRHLDFPEHRWMPIEFEPIQGVPGFERGYDLFGDSSMMLLPTPSHTPGSVSMLVERQDPGPALLVGDVTYDAKRMLADGTLPGVGNRSELAQTTRRIRALHQARTELSILAAHDPDTANRTIQ
jgi:N-acyl homoserine lactone hydrolase